MWNLMRRLVAVGPVDSASQLEVRRILMSISLLTIFHVVVNKGIITTQHHQRTVPWPSGHCHRQDNPRRHLFETIAQTKTRP